VNRLWPRAIALGLAVIAAALLLKGAHPLVVLAVFAAGFAVLFVRLRRSAGSRAPTGAELAGLQHATADPFGILGYPLVLLSRTDAPAIEEVAWGRWRALDVHVFGLSFDSPPVLERSPVRTVFSCAMSRVDAELPALVVEPQVFSTSLSGPPGLERLETGDAAFDAIMHEWSDDETFARTLLDPNGREWLRPLESRWGFETRGHVAMVYGPRRDEPDPIEILEFLRGLLGRLPEEQGRRPTFEEPPPES
jgi:hypothetical protein